MFTGIVADRGEIVKADAVVRGRVLWIRSAAAADCPLGGSVSVDGVCLTVTELHGDVVRFDVSDETLQRSTLGAKDAGDPVNIERPLRVGDELGGHMVQGHVDGVGRIEYVGDSGDGRRVVISAPPELLRYVVDKGSVTVDGVSLTVSGATPSSFEVALVPHTLEVTTLGAAEPGREVNIEVDVLAKYVERLVAAQ
jgi:riboflavin synthase